MTRRWLLFVVGSVALGVALTAWLAPDAGPSVALHPPPVVAPPPGPGRIEPARAVATAAVPRPPAGGVVPVDFPVEEGGEDGGFEHAITREPDPAPPIDPDQVFAPDLHGLAGAAVTRRQGLVDCIHAYQQQTGDQGYEGRFTIKLTVSPGEGGRGQLATEVVNGPDDVQLQACLDRVMGNARFEAPDHPASVYWPIPLTDPDEPRPAESEP